MKISNALLCFLFLAANFCSLVGQKSDYDLHKQYPPAQLKEDLAILKRHLETVHAGLYTYTPKEELDKHFATIESQLDQPMTDIAFYRLVSPLLTPIGNGHTNIQPPDGFLAQHRTNFSIFPISIKWIEGSLYTLRDLGTTETTPLGAKILTINNMKADSLFLAMRNHTTRDGFNLSNPNDHLSLRFRHYYSYLIGQPDTFHLRLQLNNGDIQEVQLAAEPYQTLLDTYNKRYAKLVEANDAPPLRFRIENGIAILTIKSFSTNYLKKRGQKFDAFLEDAFQQIADQKIEHLILDMRNNGGGDPEPTIALFGYLHDQVFTFYKEISIITRNVPDNRLYKDKLFFQELFISLRTKKDEDRYHLKGISGLKPSPPLSPRFDGELYILGNGRSFSATGEMSAILKEHNRGVFIGEEIGGNPVQNTSGAMLRLQLPHTSLNVVNPIVLWKMNVTFENTGHGVQPDYPVVATIDDLMSGRDAVLEFAKDLAQQNQQKAKASSE
ncbi:MAG: S41 family peptidase [Bacteroidota bacterium]